MNSKKLSLAIFAVSLVAAACAAPIGDFAEQGISSTSSLAAEVVSSTTTEPGELESSTSTQPNTASSESRIESAVQSTFVDSSGHQVVAQTAKGDYIISDHETGATASYDALRLILWTNVGVERVGSISLDDPFLTKQSALQAIALDYLEQGKANVIERDGRATVAFEYREDYVFDEQQVITDHVVEIDLDTGLVVRHDEIHLSPPENAGSDTPTPGLVVSRGDLDTSDLAPTKPSNRLFDDGFILVDTLEGAAELAGRPIPDIGPLLPDGYELAQIAYGDEPAGRVDRQDMVVLTYRKWAWRIDVSIRSIGTGEGWTNPFDLDGRLEPAQVVDGFEVYRGDLSVPTHAWGISGDSVVTVSGAIDLRTLAGVLRSFS